MLPILVTGIFDQMFNDVGMIAFGSLALFSLVLIVIATVIMFKMQIPSPLIFIVISLGSMGLFIMFSKDQTIKIILGIVGIILGTAIALFFMRVFNDG